MSTNEAEGEPTPPLDRLFASAREARGLSEVELARLWRRMRPPKAPIAPSRLVSMRLALTTKALVRLALVMGILCGGTGAVVAARYGLLPGFAREPEPASVETPTRARSKRAPTPTRPRSTALVEPAPAAPPAAPPIAAPEPAAVPARAPHRTIAAPVRRAPSWSASAVSARPAPIQPTPDVAPAPPATSPPPATTPPPPDLAGESALITRAFERLRRAHDAQGALAALAMHQQLFPHGLLTREAALGRIEALLTLERDDEALAALERLSFGMRGRDVELRLVRGELRARSNCRRALDDFGAVLAAGRDDLAERALYGRAICLERIGDEDGARAARDRYEQRYPRGRFAGSAKAP